MNNTFKEIQAQSKAATDSVKAAQNANKLTEESIRGRIAFKNVRIEKPLAKLEL